MLETRHFSNPTLAVWGDGRDATVACGRHATIQSIIVAYLRYAGLAAVAVPHTALPPVAYVGLLKYRAFGTKGKMELTAKRVLL